MRLVSNVSANLTAAFHFTDAHLRNAKEGSKLFEAIAAVDNEEAVSQAKLYSTKNNFNLSNFCSQILNGVFQKK